MCRLLKSSDITQNISDCGQDQKAEGQRNHSLDQPTIRKPSGIFGDFSDQPGVMNKGERTRCNEQSQGEEKEKCAEDIDHCLYAVAETLKKKVNPYMGLLFQADRNAQ